MPKVLSHAATSIRGVEVTHNGEGVEALTFIKSHDWVAPDGSRRQSDTKIAFVGTRDELEEFVDRICAAMDAEPKYLHNSPSRASRRDKQGEQK